MTTRRTWTPITIECTYGGKAGTWSQNTPTNTQVPDPDYGTFHHAKDPGFGSMSFPNIHRSQVMSTDDRVAIIDRVIRIMHSYGPAESYDAGMALMRRHNITADEINARIRDQHTRNPEGTP